MKFKGTVKKNGPSKKKVGKTKAGSYKVSLGKLSNKKTSRLAKQGKLKTKVKKKERKNKIAAQNQNEKEQKAEDESKANNADKEDEVSEGDSASEEEIDPEDTSYFDHLSNAWEFAKENLSFEERQKAKKRKREDEDEGEEYEQGARTFATEEDKGDMKMALPIISNGKVIKRMVKKERVEEAVEEWEMDTPEVKPKGDNDKQASQRERESDYVKTLNSAQLFAYRQAMLTEKKAKISALSHAILEDPQNNISKLKDLRLLLGEHNLGVSLTIRKYAMVSLMEVFKDIVPGYRMRIPTDKETSSKVKQETKSLLDYEASFLLNYRIYLEFLETMAKVKPIPDRSFLTKHGINNLKVPGSSAVELGQIAVKCLCEMLVNHPHFNYRNNLIITIVRLSNHGKPGFSAPACDAIKKIFRTDKKGDVILEIVRAIGRMVKRLNYDVRPQVLMTFLALKIKEVDLSSISKKADKMTRAERMKKFSRKERKNMKLKEKLDKELLETKATEDKSQIMRLCKMLFESVGRRVSIVNSELPAKSRICATCKHTEIIQSVFETYIRVIKLASDSLLLGPVLEGLAQFAHLINIEYFDSLFAAFNRLIESGDLTTRETLHCLQTAFTILSGQGSVLNIDPSGFYKHLYAALMSVDLGTSNETTPIVLECLDVMISKRRKQVSQQRVLAFMKRLCSLCLQQTPDTAMSFLAAIRCFLHTYKHTDVLVDTDAQGSGVYLPLLEDPEHCCANNTSLWELHLLRQHYEPDVRKYSEHLLRAAPLTGPHQLSAELSRTSAKNLYKTYNLRETFHERIPEKFGSKKKKYLTSGFADSDFEDYTTQILKSVESFDDDDESSDDDDSAMDVS